nr:MAG TPA: hypothetical protein [Caudoviricetes sp.]
MQRQLKQERWRGNERSPSVTEAIFKSKKAVKK